MMTVCALSAAETIICDVAVVGGGSAGFAAALSAAELGSSVVLVEKEKMLGGTSTIGGVNNWEPVWGATGVPKRVWRRLSRIPGAAGVYEFAHHCAWRRKGEPVFPGGLLRVNPALPYEKTLRRHGPGMGNEAWFRENCHGVIFEPRAMADVMEAMLRETGRCRTMLGVECTGVERDGGRVAALRFSDGSVVRARIVVDACSAVCAMMGCEMMRGREEKSRLNEPGAPDVPSERMNGATLIYRVAPRGDCGEGLHELPAGVPEKCWWGNFPYAFCCTYPNGDVGVNMLPTISGGEALRLGERGAYEECRRRVHAHWRWMQSRWPDFRRYQLKEIAPVLALRETARVRGDYVLNQNDLIAGLSGQRHDDVIALADHCMDSHGGGGPGGELKEPYGIPYRCLLPRGVENVLIAGRCASFSSIAASSCRLSRTMMQLGEAAGAAAHLAASRGCGIRGVSAADIRAAMSVLDDASGVRSL